MSDEGEVKLEALAKYGTTSLALVHDPDDDDDEDEDDEDEDGYPADDDVIMLKDVEVPERYYKRILTGSEVLDTIFGGDNPGLLLGSCILFTGMPGAGKSTMALQVADMLSQRGLSVVYNIGEESREQVKLAAKRLQITGNFPLAKKQTVDELCKYCVDRGVEVLIQDSLQTLQPPGDDEEQEKWSDRRLLKYNTKKLMELSKDHDVIIILIGQITKGGDFAGPMAIKHVVDVHAHLNLNKDTGNRVFNLQKNRFGPAHMPHEFFLSGQGLELNAAPISADDEGGRPTRAADRRSAARTIAKKLFLDGEELSGYTYESNDELRKLDISGGFWRAVLRMAVRDVESEGHVVGCKQVDRRETFFIEI